jgi:DNA-binding HxlR family transcriptional regulator
MNRRSYRQHCGLARALDVVGERWTLLIVRDLLLGPKRFGDLSRSLEGITTNLLSKRLREMTAAGLLEKCAQDGPSRGEAYALTESGRALESVVSEFGRWGGRLLAHPRPSDRRDVGWALLSMKRRYRGGLVFVAEIRSAGRFFELRLGLDRLDIVEKPSESAAVRVSMTERALFDVFFGGAETSPREERGDIVVTGERARFRDLIRAFRPVDASGGGDAPKRVVGRP